MKTSTFIKIFLSILFVDIVLKAIFDTFSPKLDLNLVKLYPHKNPGFFLGSAVNSTPLLRIVTYSLIGMYASILIFIAFYLLKKKGATLLNLSLPFLASGIMGNTIDKIFYGYVIDFIELHFFSNPIAINIADLSILLSIAFLIFSLFFEYSKIFREKELRAKIWINTKLQKEFLLIMLFCLLSFSLTISMFSYSLTQASQIQSIGTIFYLGTLLITIFHCLIAAFLSIKSSHAASGPLLNFKKQIAELSQGNESPSLKLREDDLHDELYECYEIIRRIKIDSKR